MQAPNDILKERISSRLDALGTNMTRAALDAGMHRDTIRNIFRGISRSPQGVTLVKLAKALECDVAYLLGEQDQVRLRGTGADIRNDPEFQNVFNSVRYILHTIAQDMPADEFTMSDDEIKAISIACANRVLKPGADVARELMSDLKTIKKLKSFETQNDG